MDEIKFLKVTPGEAIEKLEACMTKGYQTVDKIREAYPAMQLDDVKLQPIRQNLS